MSQMFETETVGTFLVWKLKWRGHGLPGPPVATSLYINVHSNHAPKTMKTLLDSLWKRMNRILSYEAPFDNAAPSYNNILSASGYKENLVHHTDLPPSNRVTWRKIWFNPSHSVNVETKIGKTHKFQKIFNKNNVKVSYSCLPNFANMIKPHNRILSEKTAQGQPKCNCWQKNTCIPEGNCIDNEPIYQCNLKKNAIIVMESIITVLQRILLKTKFINTEIYSSTKVRQIS